MDISLSCEPKILNALSASDAQAKASLLKALADPNRLRLLSMVKSSGVNCNRGEEVCVCEMIGGLGLG